MPSNVQEAPRVDRLIPLAAVARLYGVGEKTVRRLVDSGRLRPIRLVPGGRLRFRERDVQALIDEATEEDT